MITDPFSGKIPAPERARAPRRSPAPKSGLDRTYRAPSTPHHTGRTSQDRRKPEGQIGNPSKPGPHRPLLRARKSPRKNPQKAIFPAKTATRTGPSGVLRPRRDGPQKRVRSNTFQRTGKTEAHLPPGISAKLSPRFRAFPACRRAAEAVSGGGLAKGVARAAPTAAAGGTQSKTNPEPQETVREY